MSSVNKFETLEAELQPFKPMLSKASDTILDQNVSAYPIFIAHQQDIDLGIPLANPPGLEGKWSFNASSLEEFVTKNVINSEKVDDFKEIYKKPEQYLCLFIIDSSGATFVFIPRV